MRPGRKDVSLHGLGDLVIVAQPDRRPRPRVEPEDVAEPPVQRVQTLDRRRAEAVHVADQRQAGKKGAAAWGHGMAHRKWNNRLNGLHWRVWPVLPIFPFPV